VGQVQRSTPPAAARLRDHGDSYCHRQPWLEHTCTNVVNVLTPLFIVKAVTQRMLRQGVAALRATRISCEEKPDKEAQRRNLQRLILSHVWRAGNSPQIAIHLRSGPLLTYADCIPGLKSCGPEQETPVYHYCASANALLSAMVRQRQNIAR